MKNIFYLLLIILAFFSCKKQSQLFCDNELVFLKSDSLELVDLNLKLDTKELVENIQNQTEKDLCDYHFLNSQIEIENEKIQFIILPFKVCNQLIHHDNLISMHINTKNDILFPSDGDYDVVKSNENISDTVFEKTVNMQNDRYRNEIIYQLVYDTSIDQNITKKRILEIFKGIIKYADSLSQSKYNKSLCKLNSEEIKNLKKQYIGIIGFIDYEILLVPESIIYSEE